LPGIQNTRTTLTASQIKNALATPIVLVPAPGAGHAIVPLSATLHLTFVTTAYTVDPNITIGFGTDSVDVFNNGWMMYPTSGMPLPFMRAPSSTFDFTTTTSSGQAAGAFDPATHIVNQPLYWTNGVDISGNTGDSTVVVNVQWLEIVVATGAIVNGSSSTVLGAFATIVSANFTNTTPVQLVAAPGANLVIIPVSSLTWSHATTDPANNDICQFAPPHDEFYHISQTPVIASSDIVNQPLSFVYNGTVASLLVGYSATGANIAQSTVFEIGPQAVGGTDSFDLFVPYVIVNVNTGALTSSSGGDVFASDTALSASQIKNAFVTAVSLIAAPGSNQVIFPIGYLVKSHFVATAFPTTTGLFPQPRISTALTVDDVNFYLAPNFLGNSTALFTGSADQIAVGTPQINSNGDFAFDVINAPVQWADDNDLSASAADSTATAMLQYLVINTTTGKPQTFATPSSASNTLALMGYGT
jgi:hypothetical protein